MLVGVVLFAGLASGWSSDNYRFDMGLTSTPGTSANTTTYRLVSSDGAAQSPVGVWSTGTYTLYSGTSSTNTPPTIASIILTDNEGNTENDLSSLAGEATDSLYWTINGLSDIENDTISSVRFELASSIQDQTINNPTDPQNSSSFNISDYDDHAYTITITDDRGASRKYTGTLTPINVAPNITSHISYRGASPNSCQKDIDCFLEIVMNEDACSLASTLERITATTSGGVDVLVDTDLSLVQETSADVCTFRSNTFSPPSSGTYTITANYTDGEGLNSNYTGKFEVALQTAPGGGGGGGGGGGETIVTTVTTTGESINFTVQPAIEEITIASGSRTSRDIEITNNNDNAINLDVYLNKDETDDALDNSITFTNGQTRIDDLSITVTDAFSGTRRFIDYTLVTPVDIENGRYRATITVEYDSETTADVVLDIVVEDSLQTKIVQLFTSPLYSFRRSVCGNNPFATTAEDSVCTEPRVYDFTITLGQVILVLVGVFSIGYLFRLRFGRKRLGSTT